MRQLGGWEEVVGAQEEEQPWFLLPVADVLTVLAPQGSVVGLSGHTPPFHLLLLQKRSQLTIAIFQLSQKWTFEMHF